MFTGFSGSLIGAAAALGGSAFGNYQARKNTKQANRQSFQDSVAGDMYSRLYGPSLSVQGLRKANLNPILALDKGWSAGSMSQRNTHKAESHSPDLLGAVNTALSRKIADADVQLKDAQTLETLSRVDSKSAIGRMLNDATGWASKFDKAIRPRGDDSWSAKASRAFNWVKSLLPPYRYGDVEVVYPDGSKSKNDHNGKNVKYFPSNVKYENGVKFVRGYKGLWYPQAK